MHYQVPVKVDATITRLEVIIPLSHDEDKEAIPEGLPHFANDVLTLNIDVDTGVIADWPQGETMEVHWKVRDSGTYRLYGHSAQGLTITDEASGDEIDNPEMMWAEIKEDYVPNIVPGAYGDYIELYIDGTGTITNWRKNACIADFFMKSDD